MVNSLLHMCAPACSSRLQLKQPKSLLSLSSLLFLSVREVSPAHVSRCWALAPASLVHGLHHHPPCAAHSALWARGRETWREGAYEVLTLRAAVRQAGGNKVWVLELESCCGACSTWTFNTHKSFSDFLSHSTPSSSSDCRRYLDTHNFFPISFARRARFVLFFSSLFGAGFQLPHCIYQLTSGLPAMMV